MNLVGIDAASFYIPNLYLPISVLANERGIEADKLEKGLGLKKMALNDANEDTATLAANALHSLILDFDIDPTTIDRIYLGTESALDGSKPTAIYASQMVEEQLAEKYGKRCFKHADITDITFACVGAVDAMQNSLDFVRANPGKKAIVIAADYAKYKLASTGEYTQGSGAVAILISENPRLLSFEREFGVSTESVFDFFKPRRIFDANSKLKDELNIDSEEVEIFLDEPVFDGQFSNLCYKRRVREAYYHLKEQINAPKSILFNDWRHLIFHLPYAFQAKRMFMDIFGLENKHLIKSLLGKELTVGEFTAEDLKTISKSKEYQEFIKQRIFPGQKISSEVGNLYTASIFVSLFSALLDSFDNNEEIVGEKIGFFAYGSGSKSKVFQATVSMEWKSVIKKINLKETLAERKAVDFEAYQALHKKELGIGRAIDDGKNKFVLDRIENNIDQLLGARYYKYID